LRSELHNKLTRGPAKPATEETDEA